MHNESHSSLEEELRMPDPDSQYRHGSDEAEEAYKANLKSQREAQEKEELVPEPKDESGKVDFKKQEQELAQKKQKMDLEDAERRKKYNKMSSKERDDARRKNRGI